MTERQIELVWKCSACGVKNLGRFTVCQNCGDPKDDSEEYEMPAQTESVASVTDPALLRMANAGAHWSCTYCGSAQRAYSHFCVNCGASLEASSPSPRDGVGMRQEPLRALVPLSASKPSKGWGYLLLVLGSFFTFLVGTCVWASKTTPPRPAPEPLVTQPPRTEFTGVVEQLAWTRTSTVQRWQLVPHEAFASEVPAGAVSVLAAGNRVHHHEDVFDHDETVYVDVEVPDGYATESYTERVECGEDCTTTPRSCRQRCSGSPRRCKEVCTNSKNGFASCRTECSGGDEHCWDDCSGGDKRCRTKYCDEKRTRRVPKTRRAKQPKVEPRYRSEPRYAPWAKYRMWEWVDIQKEVSSGTDASPFWPVLDAGAKAKPVVRPVLLVPASGASPEMDQPGKPRAERELHVETFEVTFRTDDGQQHRYRPASAEEFASLTVGTSRALTILGGDVALRP